VADQLARAGFEIVRNAEAHLGLSTSLAAAARASARQDGMLVCLADMPQVGAGHLEALLAAVGPEGIAASSAGSGGPRSPPAVFAARHFNTLQQLSGDVGARALLRLATIVAAPSSELIDLDTEADFRRHSREPR
jgi:molybdenum cofactor cytidylyltransferase